MDSQKQAAIVHQLEYYLSDKNLEHDSFFHGKISADPNGYLDLELIMQCNKVKTSGWTIDDIVSASKKSELVELSSDEKRIRRKNNLPLPKLDLALLQKKRKNPEKENKENNSPLAEPVFLKITSDKDVGDVWKSINEKYSKINPTLSVIYTRFKTNEGHFGVVPMSKNIKDSEGKISFEKSFELDGVNYKVELCEGEDLINFYKDHGSHYELCAKKDKNKKKEKKNKTKLNKPVTLGNTIYVDIGEIKGHLRKITNEQKEFEPFKTEDEMFIRGLLEYHPDKEKILKGADYLTIGKVDPHKYSKFYYAMGKDKKTDFVLNKCIERIGNEDRKKPKE